MDVNRPVWRKAIKACAELQGEDFQEFTLHFVEKEEICRLHDEYFDDPSPTDCISFPIDGPDEPYRILGDVFICPEVAKAYVEKKGGGFKQEAMLYAVHGLLHLFGYDDMTPKEKRVMRRYEKKHLLNLEAKGILKAL